MHQQQTAFENIVGEGEIAHNEQFLPFPQCLLLNRIIVSPFFHTFDIISVFPVEFEKPKIGMSGKELRNKAFENIVRKCLKEALSPLPTMLFNPARYFIPLFDQQSFCCLENVFNSE